MLSHPCEEIGIGRESLAKGKNLPQARCRQPRHLGKKVITGAVAIALECEQDRKVGNRSAVLLESTQSPVVQNNEPWEVEILESAKGNDRVIRLRHARTVVHRTEQRSQLADARFGDRRDAHEMLSRR